MIVKIMMIMMVSMIEKMLIVMLMFSTSHFKMYYLL